MIFFDIDNTLVDQRGAEAAAAAPFLAACDDLLPRRVPVAQFCRRWRFLREKHNRDFLAGRASALEQRRRRVREFFAPRRLNDTEADHRYALFQHYYFTALRLYDDVLPCLSALAGTPLGIISNGSAAQQRAKLTATGIERYFALVLISEEAGCAKPKRQIFHEACRRAGKTPADCIYVGDRFDIDALASRAAGLRGLWLNRSLRRQRSGAPVLCSLDELASQLRARSAA